MSKSTVPTEDLTYHGKPLCADPAGMSLAELALLLNAGRTVQLYLEPGDGTRYDLIIAPVMDGDIIDTLLVGRTTGKGGEFRAGALLPNLDSATPEYCHAEVERLANGYAWSLHLLMWWFGKLWDAINA
jgi:hypothetical protein